MDVDPLLSGHKTGDGTSVFEKSGKNFFEQVKLIHEKSPEDLKKKMNNGRFPIHEAAQLGDNSAISFLSDNGCSLTELDDDKWNVFHHAAFSGKGGTITVLVGCLGEEESKRLLRQKDEDGSEPLLFTQLGNHKAAEAIIQSYLRGPSSGAEDKKAALASARKEMQNYAINGFTALGKMMLTEAGIPLDGDDDGLRIGFMKKQFLPCCDINSMVTRESAKEGREEIADFLIGNGGMRDIVDTTQFSEWNGRGRDVEKRSELKVPVDLAINVYLGKNALRVEPKKSSGCPCVIF